MRLKDLSEWISLWALPDMYAGIPGQGATDAWYNLLLELELDDLQGTSYCGGTAYIQKFFDQIQRGIVYKAAEEGGMPKHILNAYTSLVENLQAHNAIAGCIGKGHTRICGIPQGCPLSMMFVAFHMRPWLMEMHQRNITAKILADDVILIAKGEHMLRDFPEALEATHRYLHDMGAIVAPTKSLNFTSSKAAKLWLEDTTWIAINAKIKVVNDLRHLGGHISTNDNMSNSTLNDRMSNGINQLHKLRYLPAAHEDKTKIILSKMFPGCFYGIECGDLNSKQLASLSAAVVNAFYPHNDNHDTELTLQAITNFTHKDIDPLSYIFKRRIMELRRLISKDKGKIIDTLDIIALYAEAAKKATIITGAPGLFCTVAPVWHHPLGSDVNYSMNDFPSPAIHPTSGQAAAFEPNIQAKGPIGLLLQSIIRIGGAIDNELNITQWKEQALSLIHTPFQFLRILVTAAAKRGSQRAAQGLKDFHRGLREIDYNVTKTAANRLTTEDQSYLNVARCGRGYDKVKLASIDDTITTECDYCGHALCDFDHITWRCQHFAPQRAEACKAIAELDPDALHPAIRRGIAPALAAVPNATFWGRPKSTARTSRRCKPPLSRFTKSSRNRYLRRLGRLALMTALLKKKGRRSKTSHSTTHLMQDKCWKQ